MAQSLPGSPAAAPPIARLAALHPLERGWRRRLGDLTWALGVIAICTGLGWFLRGRLNLAALATPYLLGLVALAALRGRAASALGAGLGLACFDFFLESPAFTFTITHWPDFLVFAAQLGIAQLVAHLMDAQRAQTRLAEAREAEAEALFALSRALGQVETEEAARAEAIRTLEALLGCRASIDAAPAPSGQALPLSEEAGLWLNLSAFQTGEPPQALLQALAQQVRLSLVSVQLAEAARQAERAAEAERTRSTLLAALGHDLRTPLATMGAAASTLMDQGEQLPPAERRELARMVHGGSQRLAELVEGLLEYTRLEGGALQLKGEWMPLEEILGVVLTRLDQSTPPPTVLLDIPPGLPLVFCDGLLLGELLTNLLSNALRHAPGSPIELRAVVTPGRFELGVTDRGPGIPPEDRERIFRKFERLASGPVRGDGLGLGLAICRAIVEVHGGHIWVEEGPGGGASFRVHLPQPPLPSDMGA